MPEQEKPDAPLLAAPRRSSLLPVAIAAVCALGAGAGGAWFLLRPEAGPATEESAHDEQTAAPVSPQGASFSERLLPLDPFIVNINGEGYTRYLKLVMALEASTPQVKQELADRAPQIRDVVIAILTSKRVEDIGDFEGKALLKEDMLRRVNDLIPAGGVQSVLFTEFVVQ